MDKKGDIMKSVIALLLNSSAGSGRASKHLEQIMNRFDFHGHSIEVLSPNSLEETKRVVSESNAERIIVVGGDGSLHYAVNATVETGRTLGLIPLGTGNDAAKALNISNQNIEESVDRCLEDPIAIDLIKSGSQYFMTSCIAGFPAQVNSRANSMQFPKGKSRYTIATLAELKKLEPSRYKLAIDNTEIEIDAMAVTVANTPYFGGGMKICPEANPSDGILDICVLGEVSRARLLYLFGKIRKGKHVDAAEVSMFRARSVTIEALGELRADGEPFRSLPASMEVVSDALLIAGARLT